MHQYFNTEGCHIREVDNLLRLYLQLKIEIKMQCHLKQYVN